MRLDVGEIYMRKLFQRWSILRNPNISLINYIQPCLWHKNKNLEVKLKAAKNAIKIFWYIIKTGKNDLILLTKTMGVSYWEEDSVDKYTSDLDSVTLLSKTG